MKQTRQYTAGCPFAGCKGGLAFDHGTISATCSGSPGHSLVITWHGGFPRVKPGR